MIGARVDCTSRVECLVSWELARMPVRVFAGPTPGRIDRSSPAARVATGTQVIVPNPDPDAPHYFEIVARGRRRGPIVGDRPLGLERAPNARDLGGYATVDEKWIRWGRLFRTDGLADLTDADRNRLAALGLAEECPSGSDDPPVVDDATLRAEAESVTSRAARSRDRALLRRLARAPLPQWVHCSVFDDRLGWSAALVLATLGVGRETIVADHLLTARFGAPPAPDRRYVDLAIETIRRRYKTFGRYLVKGLDLDERTYRALRARYVTDR